MRFNINWEYFKNASLRVIKLVSSFLILMLLTKLLSKDLVGSYTYFLSVISVFSIPIVNGLNNFILREVAKNHKYKKIINFIIKSFFIYILIFSGFLVFFSYLYYTKSITLTSEISILPFFNVFFLGLLALFSSVLKGHGKVFISDLPEMFIKPAVLIILFTLFSKYNLLNLRNILFIELFSTIVALLFLILKNRGFYLNILKYKSSLSNKCLLYYRKSMPFLFLGAVVILHSNIDIILLGYFNFIEDLATYKIVYMINRSISFIAFSVYVVISSKITFLYKSKKVREIQKMVDKMNLGLVLVTTIFTIMLMTFSSDIIVIAFGEEYLSGRSSLLIFLFSFYIMVLNGPSGNILQLTGNQNTILVGRIFFVILNIILDIIFIPKYGMTAAVVSTSFCLVTLSFITVFLCKYKTGINSDFYTIIFRRLKHRY